MNRSAVLARFLRETAADVVMLAGRYTLLDQSALDDVLPAARDASTATLPIAAWELAVGTCMLVQTAAHHLSCAARAESRNDLSTCRTI